MTPRLRLDVVVQVEDVAWVPRALQGLESSVFGVAVDGPAHRGSILGALVAVAAGDGVRLDDRERLLEPVPVGVIVSGVVPAGVGAQVELR